MSALTDSEMKSFMAIVPTKYKSIVINWYNQLIKKVSARIKGKYGLDFSTAEDIAVASATYSLAYFIQNNDFPKEVDDWMAVAQKKANFLALDCCAFARKRALLQIDEPQHLGSEEIQTESSLVSRWSYGTWKASRQDEETRVRSMAVKAVLSKVIEAMKVKDKEKTEDIFKAFYFDGLPMAEVGHRYGVTTNNGYQIIFKVKEAYMAYGKNLVEHHLENVEMAA